MKIAGIDVGRVVGVAVVEASPQRVRLCAAERLELDRLEDPLAVLHACNWIAQQAGGCSRAVLEAPLPTLAAGSLVEAAEMRGAIVLRLTSAGIPVARIAPNSVKKAVAGYGLATKAQVRRALLARLGWDIANEHAADAAAIAVACLMAEGRITLPPAPPLPRRRRAVVVRRNGALVVRADRRSVLPAALRR